MSTDKTEADNKAAQPDKAGRPPQTGLMLVSGLWLAGLGAVALLTAPHSTANPVYLPASAATEEADQRAARASVSVQNSVDFIVRFKDVEQINTCLHIFKEDPDGARAVFESWAAEHATLSGMTLKRTSYAGELILSWSTEDGYRPNRADIIAKQRELQAMSVVKYADPDYTAHAGGTTQ
jgi:hypothetical protein